MNPPLYISHTNATLYLYGSLHPRHRRLTSYYLAKWAEKKRNPYDLKRWIYQMRDIDAIKLWLKLPIDERRLKANRERFVHNK